MRRSLERLLVVTVLVLATSWIASRVYEATVVRETIMGRVDREFRDLAEPPRILVMGDSHAMRGIDPGELGSAYDLCSFGETTIRTWYRLRWVLEEYEKASSIETIVLPVDYTTFSRWTVLEAEHLGFWRRYLDFGEIGGETDEPIRMAGLRLQGAFASYFDCRRDILAWMELKVLGMRAPYRIERGFTGELGGGSRNAGPRARHHFEGRRLVDPVLEKYMRRSVALAREHHKRVVLLEYPVSRRYHQLASAYFEKAGQPIPRAETLGRELGVDALSARDMFYDRDDMFWDSDHLNGEGARILSRWLAERLAELR